MAQPLEIQYRPIADLIPYARNSRTHSDEQVGQIAGSIKEFGFTNPVLIDEEGGIIAGHGRVMAASRLKLAEVPTITLTGLTPAQKRAYIIADNRLPLNASWDFEMLAVELDELRDMDFDLGLLGFSSQELNDLIGTPNPPPEEPAGNGNADETPEVEAVEVSQAGDVWQLGPHRVMCGDSTSAADVATLCNGVRAHLIHADPPYGMGKEADGVVNDNLYGDELDAFQMAWWRAFRAHVQPNASAYIWGNAPDLWRLWWRGGLADSEPMTLRNEIVWDKKNIAGMASPDLTQYPEATERCLFIQLGRYVFKVNQTKDDYWPGWEPIRTYLCEQRDKAGLTAGKVKEIVGNHMYGHWFGTSQWAFISQDNYEKLQRAARPHFDKPYADLLAEYKQLQAVFNGEVRDPAREEFDAARPYFDNAHDVMRDVWEFPRVIGDERHGHATPKPVAMMERVMRSSAREGEVVLEPFGGSGSTLMGAEKTGRVCFSMELQAKYVDVIIRRWQNFTGKKATLDGDGRTFDEIAAERTGAGDTTAD